MNNLKRMKLILITFVATILVASTSVAQVPNYVPTNGLVGWWGFNGNANDESGNGNNGTVNGATLTSDRFGNPSSAYLFSGSESIDINEMFDFQQRTTNMWIKNSDLNWGSITRLALDNDNINMNYGLVQFGSQVGLPDSLGINQGNVNMRHIAILDEWCMMTLVRDAVNATWYFNGQEYAIQPAGLAVSNWNLIYTRIGGRSDNSRFWIGKIDDIGIWNRALTPCEISDLYNAQLGTTGSETITECSSFTWGANNQTYTSTGQYTAVLTNSAGCDSTITLNLTINNVDNGITQVDDFTLEANASGATYQWIDCTDNSPIVGATNQQFIPTQNGEYAVIVTQNGCSDTTECLSVVRLSIEENQNQTLKVYPNPATSSITISSESNIVGKSFTILNQLGQVVISGEIKHQDMVVNLTNLSAGVYVINISGESQSSFRIVKD
jgi:hypothetical protein